MSAKTDWIVRGLMVAAAMTFCAGILHLFAKHGSAPLGAMMIGLGVMNLVLAAQRRRLNASRAALTAVGVLPKGRAK